MEVIKMVDVSKKLENAIKIAKNFTFNPETKVWLLADNEGWTNSYFMELGALNTERAKAQAILNGCNTNFDTAKKNRPKAKVCLEGLSKGERVRDMEWDLSDNTLILKGKTIKSKVNPTFIKYFFTAYNPTGLKLRVTGELTPIKVFSWGELVGVIMPIQAN